MNSNHWNTTAKVARRELEFVQTLYNEIGEDAQTNYSDTLKRFVAYKESQLTALEESALLSAKVDDLLDKVSDLVNQGDERNKQAEKIAKQLYSGPTYNATYLHSDTIDELSRSYVSMSVFQNKGDIYFFGAYVFKQIECILNYFINDSVNFHTFLTDLKSPVVRKGKSEEIPLGKSIIYPFSGYPESIGEVSFNTKLGYFTWFFQKKIHNLRETPYVESNAYYYLNTARKKAFHGWFIADGAEIDRVNRIEGNNALFFSMFHKLLFDITEVFFNHRSWIIPPRK